MTATVSASVVGDLRRARRRRRVTEIHWIDALYQVYITGLGIMGLVLVLSTAIGDGRLDVEGVARIRTEAPPVLGLAVAVAVFVGLRSGSRGGPVAVEAADVRHVLLAPVDRGTALRAPAMRQLRFATFVAVAVGAATGQFAGRRLPGAGAAWVGAGALFGLTLVGIGLGSALLASGRRVPSWVATVLAGGLVTWSVADVADLGLGPTSGTDFPMAPATFVGRIAIWPLHFDPLGLLAVLLAGVLVAVGLAGIAGVSLEAAERRTALVGQLRFAVTLQDLRTVLVLRRQLAADLPRHRPWLRALRAPGRARFPVWQRGWRGVLRWPLPRLLRLVVLAVVSGFALRGVWAGTTPLVVVVGLAGWIAALDVVEPLAQETDHPGRRDTYPLEEGRLMVRHLPVPACLMAMVVALTGAVAAGGGSSALDPGVMLVAGVPLALAAVAGAAVSVLMGAPKPFDQLAVASPEIAGMRTALRTVWPPLLATVGVLPVLLARMARDDGRAILSGAWTGSAVVVGVMAVVAGWVRFRVDISEWWAAAMESAKHPATAAAAAEDEDERDADEKGGNR